MRSLEKMVEPDYGNLPIGYTFNGRYQILKPLEKGSGGSVYLVKDLIMMCMGKHENFEAWQK